MKIIDNPFFKAITIILLYYVFIAGMLRPLNPGIMNLNVSSVSTGASIDLSVKTYNSHLKNANNIAFLKLENNQWIQSTKITATDNNFAHIHFLLPATLPENKSLESVTLIVSNPTDGTFIRPAALVINRDSGAIDNQVKWQSGEFNQLYKGSGAGFPFRLILEETIRNIFYHVPLWFAMFFLFLLAAWYSLQYLRNETSIALDKAYSLNRTGFIFGLLGIMTGSVWAKFTWGTFWTGDIKLNMTAIAMLIYAAYFILWQSFKDDQVRGRVSAVYSIFAFVAMVPLIFVIPRLYDSLHPGNGGNPALGGEDLDNTMRVVFYPAVIGFIMLGLWITNIVFKIRRLDHQLSE